MAPVALIEHMVRVGARPIEHLLVLTSSTVDEHRRVYCTEYEKCLDYADAVKWVSFSCTRCKVTSEMPMEERRADAERIGRVYRGENTLHAWR